MSAHFSWFSDFCKQIWFAGELKNWQWSSLHLTFPPNFLQFKQAQSVFGNILACWGYNVEKSNINHPFKAKNFDQRIWCAKTIDYWVVKQIETLKDRLDLSPVEAVTFLRMRDNACKNMKSGSPEKMHTGWGIAVDTM